MTPAEWLRQDLAGEAGRLALVTVGGKGLAGTVAPGEVVAVDLGQTVPSPPGIFMVWDGVAMAAARLDGLTHARAPCEAAGQLRIVGRMIGRWQRV